VVVGEGAPAMERLTKAHECIERGARLLATNPDNWCPVSSEKTRPGAGATAAFLEASTGPARLLSGQAERLHVPSRPPQTRGLPVERNRITFVMIGDTMETDIRGAVEAGLQSFLVLTGSTQMIAAWKRTGSKPSATA
jgi:NagD protein